jgi:hypothetical protein
MAQPFVVLAFPLQKTFDGISHVLNKPKKSRDNHCLLKHGVNPFISTNEQQSCTDVL